MNTGFDFASAGSRKISRLVDGAFFYIARGGICCWLLRKPEAQSLAFLGFDDGGSAFFVRGRYIFSRGSLFFEVKKGVKPRFF